MRTRFDQFAKQMLKEALAPRGHVETDAEVSPDTQRIDVWFVPDPDRPPAPAPFGLLARLTRTACLLEPFHRTPDAGELLACLHKHLGFGRILAQRPSPPPSPTLWVISAGRPLSSIHGLSLRRTRDFPRGIYLGPPLLRLGLCVVSELPATPDTLLLRLMGTGSVLKRAILELKALPDDAPERGIALPILLRLRFEIPAEPEQRTSEDQEFLMSTEDAYEVWERRVREEGVEKGLAKGLMKGLMKGLVTCYEARFGTMPSDLRALVEATRDEATLQAWYTVMITRSADEIAATLQASRSR